ncbi:helix-turn-helix domain-containing protein [Aquabacterium sp.]|uniref:helix-turn-helix domain-containing protein n=1 Tax=Aquabacterium sp. TaxID=1872578 RepID=UPI003416790A
MTRPGLLVTPAEAARILGVTPSTVWRWVTAGRMPTPVFSERRRMRFARMDVEALLKAS